MNLHDHYASIHFYLWGGYFWEAREEASKAAAQFDDSTARFWQAYCELRLGRRAQAQELASLSSDAETRPMWARLKAMLGGGGTETAAGGSDFAKANLVFLSLYEGDERGARDQSRKLGASHHFADLARAAVALRTSDPSGLDTASEAQRFIESARAAKPDAPLAKILCLRVAEARGDIAEASRLATGLELPDSRICDLEKAAAASAAGVWQAAAASAASAMAWGETNLPALEAAVLAALGGGGAVESFFVRALEVVERQYGFEAAGAERLAALAGLTALGAQPALIAAVKAALERAVKVGGARFSPLLALARSCAAGGDSQRAAKVFREAAKLDAGSPEPLLGLLELAIIREDTDEAQASADFLREFFHGLAETRPDFALLEALLELLLARGEPDPANRSRRLEAASKAAATAGGRMLSGPPRRINAGLLLGTARLLLRDGEAPAALLAAGVVPRGLGPAAADAAATILRGLATRLPGDPASPLLAAKADIMRDRPDAAESALRRILVSDAGNPGAHTLLLASALRSGAADAALRAVADATAANFELLSSPGFLALKGRAELAAGDAAAAVKTLEKAAGLCGNDNDAALQVDAALAPAQAAVGDFAAARATVANMLGRVSEGGCGVLASLASADVALLAGDSKRAVDILRNVEPQDEGFAVARRRLATIYRDVLSQPAAFVGCFRDIHGVERSPQSARQLLEALVSVQEFDAGSALLSELNGDADPPAELAPLAVACLVGQARYAAAEAMLRRRLAASPKCPTATLGLLKLLKRLKKTDDMLAIASSVESVAASGGNESFSARADRIEALLLLADAAKLRGDHSAASRFLDSAQTLQTAAGVAAAEDRTRMSQILLRRARTAGPQELSAVVEEGLALGVDPQGFLRLSAETRYEQRRFDAAKEHCKRALKVDARCALSTRVLADCMLATDQLDAAAKGFWKILERQIREAQPPAALSVLAYIYRHLGALPGFAAEFAKIREKHASPELPVFHLTEGLLHYFARKPNLAVAALSAARAEPALRDRATLILIDIYIHDDFFPLYSNFFQKEKFKVFDKKHLSDLTTLASSLGPDRGLERRVFEAAIEFLSDPLRAESTLRKLDSTESDPGFSRVASIVLYFQCLVLLRLRNKDRLKDVLIRMRDLEFTPRDCWDEYTFRCHLLCADTLLFKEKVEPARALIAKVISKCRSMLLAHDYLLALCDYTKENPIEILKTAFALTGFQDPNLGYKLAKHLLKEENFVECFQVCKQVLEHNPKFVLIESEVLALARENLLNNY